MHTRAAWFISRARKSFRKVVAVVTSDIAPAATTVKRLFVSDVLAHDRFAILVDGDVLVEVDYPTARRYWLGRITLAELVNSSVEVQTDGK